jgi:hypothetical protein
VRDVRAVLRNLAGAVGVELTLENVDWTQPGEDESVARATLAAFRAATVAEAFLLPADDAELVRRVADGLEAGWLPGEPFLARVPNQGRPFRRADLARIDAWAEERRAEAQGGS